MNKVLIAASSFSEESLDMLRNKGIDYIVNDTGKRYSKEDLIKNAQGCVGIAAGLELYDAEVLGALPELKYISRCGVGLDNIDLDIVKDRGIKVFNTPDAVVQPVAELTVGLILDLLRSITIQTEMLKKGEWKRVQGHLLACKRVGIIGLGRIGKKVTQMLQALGAQVVVSDPLFNESWGKDNYVQNYSLSKLLEMCDIITLHLSAEKDSQFCLGKDEFSRMKKGVFIVNVARGTFINESALCEALNSGHVAAAALDVFENEPYSGPLMSQGNVIVTPHVGSFTKESRRQMELETINHLLNVIQC